MRFQFIFISVLALGIASCGSNDNGTDLLGQPPYEELTDSIALQPQNASLYYKRGSQLYANQQNELALADIRKAYSLQPTEEFALSVVTLLKQKSIDSATLFLQEAVKRIPESIALQIGLARAYQSKGQRKEALAIADKIIDQYPGQLDALTLKSELLGEENRGTESIAYLERAYSLVPSDPSLAYDLAYEYAQLKDAKALKLTDSLIRAKAPEIEKAFYIKGLYLSNSGNIAGAIQAFDLAIRSNYNFMDAYRDKGQALHRQRKYGEAIKTYELALKVAPAEAEFYYLVGQSQEAMGQKSEARLNYQKAFGLDKSLTEAKEAADKL